MNSYRQALGVSRINHRGADRLAPELSTVQASEARSVFDDKLDVLDFVDQFVQDVNQPSLQTTERRIDRDGLGVWAGTQPDIQHRIHYDESRAAAYMGNTPLEAEKYQPFIFRALAIEILHIVLCQEP